MHLYFTVTNNLIYDQRMTRICNSLANVGYRVTLIGRQGKNPQPLPPESFNRVRLWCPIHKGFLFYCLFNIQLFFYLLFKKLDGICAIDLDTIIPCLLVSKIRGKPRIYDAHELFCEMKEISSRPHIYSFWKWIERNTVRHFKYGYTVNKPIALAFNKMYALEYAVIRNTPIYTGRLEAVKGKYILYQGAVNEGRSFETLIPAMQWVDIPLWICGDGNFMNQARALVEKHGLGQKVIFKGMINPNELKFITAGAILGFTLFEPDAKSNYYSLANRFFDYLHAGIPQICSNFPVYREINEQYQVACLVDDLSPQNLAKEINRLLNDEALRTEMHVSCLKAAQVFNWQEEEKNLIHFYKQIFG